MDRETLRNKLEELNEDLSLVLVNENCFFIAYKDVNILYCDMTAGLDYNIIVRHYDGIDSDLQNDIRSIRPKVMLLLLETM